MGANATPLTTRNYPTRRQWLLLAIVVLAGVAAYLNILSNQFVYDDNLQITRNPQLRDLRQLGKAFSQPVWSFVAPQGKVLSNYYRPLHVLTYTLIHQVSELNPRGYHLASILFHALATALVYLVILRLAGLDLLALTVALLFALHPIHTEAVTWIAGIADVECSFFYLLSFYGWLRWRDSQEGERAARWWLVVASGAFLLALLAKEMALTLPVVVLLYEWLAAGKTRALRLRRLAGGLWPLGATLAAYVGLRLWALGLMAPISNGHELTPKEYLLSVLALVGKYFEKVFLPIDLNAYYVFTPSRSWVEPFVLLGTILVTLLLGVLLYARRWPASLRLPLFGAAWILLTLPPVLAIRQVGYNVFTERYLYLPSVGACLVLGALLWRLYSSRPMALRAAAVVASLLVLALFAVQTVRRNRDWKDEFTLYQQTVKVSPTATVIHNGLGRVLFQRGEFQQALAAHQAALAAEKRNYRQDNLFLADAYAGMGTVHLTLGQVGEAEQSFHQALDHAPHHDAYLNLGVIAFQRKDFETAYALSLRAVQVFPVYDLAYNNAGAALLALQRPQEAIPYLEQAVKLSPRYTQAQMNLAIAYQQTQQTPKAIEQLRAIVVREPDNQAAVRFLDSLLQSARPVPAQPP